MRVAAILSVAVVALAVAALLASAVAAWAAEGAAPRPAISVTVSGGGYVRDVTIRLTATKGGRPVRGATVLASAGMSAPGHFMTVPARAAAERAPGLYRARLRFLMLGRWVLKISVTGPGLAPTTTRLTLQLSP